MYREEVEANDLIDSKLFRHWKRLSRHSESESYSDLSR
jgi:hypothetical protein